MSNIFDALHRAMFDQLFSLDEEGRKAKAQLLREAGVPEEMIVELTKPGIQPGMSFGGAKTVDVMNVVEVVLFRQHAGSVLLRVKRPPFDEAGHIEVEVLEVGPPSEEQPPHQVEHAASALLVGQDRGKRAVPVQPITEGTGMKTPDDIRDIASYTERTNQLNDLDAVQVALKMLERAGATVQVGPYVGQVGVRLPGSLWQPLHELRNPK